METLVFLIIVGILSTIFGKGAKSRPRNRTNLPNSLSEMKTLFHNQMDHSMPRKMENDVIKQPENMEEKIGRKYRQIKQEQVMEEVLQPVSPSTNPQVEPINSINEDNKPRFSEELDPQTVINGLIWSEILGEPRAKKPHFARRQ